MKKKKKGISKERLQRKENNRGNLSLGDQSAQKANGNGGKRSGRTTRQVERAESTLKSEGKIEHDIRVFKKKRRRSREGKRRE